MMCRILCTIIAIISFVCADAQTNDIDKERIRAAVERMIAQYPHSTLQDIYKSFFQDRFGPGHLVADTAKAIGYLRAELDEAKETGIMLYEPTGDQRALGSRMVTVRLVRDVMPSRRHCATTPR